MGEADEACFGGGVVCLPRVAYEADDGADIDDAACAGFEHSAGGGADPAEGAGEVGIDYGGPIFVGHTHDETIFSDAGVIDEGGEWTAGLFFHGGDDLESGGGIGDIGRMDGGVATSCDNGVADFVEFLHLAGDEGDGPSF